MRQATLRVLVALVVIGAATLVIGNGRASRVSAQGPAYGTTYTMPAATTAISMPLQTGQQASYGASSGDTPMPGGWTVPDSCWLWDSWCAYCTRWQGSTVCAAYPPSHRGAGQ